MKKFLTVFVCLLLFTNSFSTSVFSKLKLLNFKENNEKLSSTITSLIEKSNSDSQRRAKDVPSPLAFSQNCANLKYVTGSYNVPKQMWYFKKALNGNIVQSMNVETTWANASSFRFTLGYELMELNIEIPFSFYYYATSTMQGMDFQLYLDDILIDEFSEKFDNSGIHLRYQSGLLRGTVYRVCPGAHTIFIKTRRIGDASSGIHPGIGVKNYITMVGYVS